MRALPIGHCNKICQTMIQLGTYRTASIKRLPLDNALPLTLFEAGYIYYLFEPGGAKLPYTLKILTLWCLINVPPAY